MKGTYEIEFSDNFFDDIRAHKKAGQKTVLAKISLLIDELREHPYSGTGNPEPLKYKFDNLEGPVFIIPKAEVLSVKYQNGSKDIFTEEKTAENTTTDNDENYYVKGQTDASKCYQGYVGAGSGTLVASLISPMVGLIPAIACSSAKPKDRNLDYPNPELMKNPDYYKGYTKKAKRIKQGKVWKNWGVGSGVNITLSFLYLIAFVSALRF